MYIAYGAATPAVPPQEFASGQVGGAPSGTNAGNGGNGGNYENASVAGSNGTYAYWTSGGKSGTVSASVTTYGGTGNNQGYAIAGYSKLRGFTNSGIIGTTNG